MSWNCTTNIILYLYRKNVEKKLFLPLNIKAKMKIKFLLLVYIYIIPTIISISNIVSTVLKFLLIFIVIPYWKLKNVHVINFLFLNFNYRILRSPFILWIHFENLRFVSIDWTLGLARRSESENVGIFIHFYTFVWKIVKGFGFFVPFAVRLVSKWKRRSVA